MTTPGHADLPCPEISQFVAGKDIQMLATS